MIKLGFVSAILADLPFEEVIPFASENRFACVEMMCWPVGKAERRYAGVTHIDAYDLSPERINSIQELLIEKGISVSALGYYPIPWRLIGNRPLFLGSISKKLSRHPPNWASVS